MSDSSKRNRLLLIGWDAADWKVISPLIDSGKMPALEGLINRGVMGNLATIRPVLSPMLWTSIATGKRANKHGIHGFTEPTPDGTGIQPITNLSRKSKAFWNIFNQSGMRGHVVGWWPSHPAEPIDGAMVSNHYQMTASLDPEKPWPIRPGTVHPTRLVDPLQPTRFHPAELDTQQILPFLPFADEIDQEKDSRLGACAKIIAECTSIHGAATWLMGNEPWDYAAVYYDAIDHFGHAFMRYHPPRQAWVSEEDFRLYSGVVEAGYRYHDMMLATLLAMAGPDTTVMLISDHGFHPDHLRVQTMPSEPAAPASEHRDFGIFVMSGPGVRRDERVYGASLLDVCPTLLTAAGLPVGDDMDGKPLVQAWIEPPNVDRIGSWEQVDGDTGQHPTDANLDPRESHQAIEQLVALGYIEQPAEDMRVAIEQTVRELRYNLALSLMDGEMHGEAMPILEELFDRFPDETRFGMRLALCYRALDRIHRLKPLIAKLKSGRVEYASRSAGQLKRLLDDIESAQAGKETGESVTEAAKELPSPTASEQKELPPQRLQRLYGVANKKQREQVRHLAKESQHNPYSFEYLDGYLHMAEGRLDAAIECFARAESVDPNRPWLPIQIGEAYLQLRRWGDAERALTRASKADDENPFVFAGLARVHLGRQENRRAAELALRAVGLLYHYPFAHYLLGVALHRLGDIDRAKQALGIALTMNPNFAQAHRRIAALYRGPLDLPEEAARHLELARELVRSNRQARIAPKPIFGLMAKDREALEHADLAKLIPERLALHPDIDPTNFITVVTGLPRSGTSMVMQMLEAGGLPLLSDGCRVADEDNPNGYFEHEGAKQLRTNKAWIEGTGGCAAKVVAQLLPHLPKQNYRYIYINRVLEEVIRSQQKMLSRGESPSNPAQDDSLMRAFAQQVRVIGQLLEKNGAAVLRIEHGDCLTKPKAVVKQINSFLGGKLDENAMARAIDPRLYRQKRSSSSPQGG